MPLVNIYLKNSDDHSRFHNVVLDLKKYIAEKLSGENISLTPSEISIRLLKVMDGSDMIGSVELEISAHSFPERVIEQDKICLDIMKYVQEKLDVKDVKVWLQLSELGHSW